MKWSMLRQFIFIITITKHAGVNMSTGGNAGNAASESATWTSLRAKLNIRHLSRIPSGEWCGSWCPNKSCKLTLERNSWGTLPIACHNLSGTPAKTAFLLVLARFSTGVSLMLRRESENPCRNSNHKSIKLSAAYQVVVLYWAIQTKWFPFVPS